MSRGQDVEPLAVLSDDGFRAVIAGPGVVAVQFSASWCQPCAEAGPEVAALASEGPVIAGRRVAFVAVDIDAAPQAAYEAGIRTVPELVLYRGGVRIGNFIGSHKKLKVRQWIEAALAPPAVHGREGVN